MDMDLVLIFSFVSTVVLIITMGVVLFPITRKLGHFLEQTAKDRAARLTGDQPVSIAPPVADQLVELMNSLESQVSYLTERQAFTERLLEERSEGAAIAPLPEE